MSDPLNTHYYPDGGKALTATPLDPYVAVTKSEFDALADRVEDLEGE